MFVGFSVLGALSFFSALEHYKDGGCFLLDSVRPRMFVCVKLRVCLSVSLRVPLDLGSALRHSRFSCQNNSPLVVLDVHLEVEAHLLPSITSLTVTLPQFLQTKL